MSKPSWYDDILKTAVAGSIGVKAEDFGKDEHECDEDGQADCDICTSCREHTSFCSVCGLSNCCGAPECDVG